MNQYLNAQTWAKEQSRPILTYITVGVVVIVLAIVGWLLYSRRATNASESMARAMAVHDAIVANPLPPNMSPGTYAFTTEEEKDKKAYEALEKAAQEYPSYNGDLARYLGAIHQLTFDGAKAEATLKQIAGGNSEVSSQARLALAERYEATGKLDDAFAEYQKLKSAPGTIPPALIDSNIARVYEAQGKTKEAVDLYFAIANNKDLRTTSLGNTAVTRLSVLAPEKVDQLPPPEPSSPMQGLGGLGGFPIR
jgi:predicted negative regulator of RcsB-dependent stress response